MIPIHNVDVAVRQIVVSEREEVVYVPRNHLVCKIVVGLLRTAPIRPIGELDQLMVVLLFVVVALVEQLQRHLYLSFWSLLGEQCLKRRAELADISAFLIES